MLRTCSWRWDPMNGLNHELGSRLNHELGSSVTRDLERSQPCTRIFQDHGTKSSPQRGWTMNVISYSLPPLTWFLWHIWWPDVPWLALITAHQLRHDCPVRDGSRGGSLAMIFWGDLCPPPKKFFNFLGGFWQCSVPVKPLTVNPLCEPGSG